MPKPLVIVESPAKARTLSRFLGDGLSRRGQLRPHPGPAGVGQRGARRHQGQVLGAAGRRHRRRLHPHYVVPADKKKHVQALKDAMKDASEVMLATDPDREGESISWHLEQLLKPKVPVRRIVFHEITEEAIRGALDHAHEDVNQNLVRAQESRRILDRLYGYTLSPVLWKKVQTGLSAGRVQSVAVRLIVEREEERLAFRTANYWDLEATLKSADGREFGATLVRVGRSPRGHRQGLRRAAASSPRPRSPGSTRRRPRRWPRRSSAACPGRSRRSTRSRPRSVRRRPSPPPRCSRRRTARSGSPPTAR